MVAVPDMRRGSPAGSDNGQGRRELLRAEGFQAYYAVPLIAKGQVNGVLEVFHRAALEADQEWLEFLETLAGQAAIAINNSGLFQGLQRSNADLARHSKGRAFGGATICALIMAINLAVFLADEQTTIVWGMTAGALAGGGWVAAGLAPAPGVGIAAAPACRGSALGAIPATCSHPSRSGWEKGSGRHRAGSRSARATAGALPASAGLD